MINFQVALVNEFSLREEHKKLLSNYYVLHWQVEYLIRKLEDDGTLIHAGGCYIPIYRDSIPADPSAQLMLSFRKQSRDFEYLPNYVLIKVKDRR
jgi:hypothetical protein